MNFVRRMVLLLLLTLLPYFAVSWLRRDGPSLPVVFSLFVMFAFVMAIWREVSRAHRELRPSDLPSSTGLAWPIALRRGLILAALYFAGWFAASRWGLIDVGRKGLSTSRLAAGLALGSCVFGLFMAAYMRFLQRPLKLDT